MSKKLIVLAVLTLSLFGCQRDDSACIVSCGPLMITATPPASDPGLQQEDDRFVGKSFTRIAETIWYRGENPLFIRLYAKAKGACHACTAEMGGYLAEYDPVRRCWEVIARSFRFSENGSYGEAPEILFLQLGPSRFGFVMMPSYMAQGIVVQRMNVFLASRSGFKQILDAPVYFDNSGSLEDESRAETIRVDMHQVVSPEKEVYDLKVKVVAKNTSPDNDDYGFRALYGDASELKLVFKNGAYVIEK
jgi:hypothetical protein